MLVKGAPGLNAGVTTDLRNRNPRTVPNNLSTELRNLELSENVLYILNVNSFPSYTKLIKLDVSRNGLEIIEDGTFDQQIQLTYLDFSFNNIRQLPSYFGPSVTQLESWHMYSGYKTTTIFIPPYFANFMPRKSWIWEVCAWKHWKTSICYQDPYRTYTYLQYL